MSPDNCTMRSAWPDPPQRGALGTVLRVATRPNAQAKTTRRALRAKKGRR